MDLVHHRNLVPDAWRAISYDQWSSDLRSVCGNFNPQTVERGDDVVGAARRIDVCGMEFAHVSNDLDCISRGWDDIRRDAQEHLFLIVQLEGSCGLEHGDRQNILDVGECILVDSTRPTTFYFGGRFSNHLSLHLPRQLMYSDSRIPFDIARKLSAHDPMAHMLHALIAKIMATTESDSASQHLRQLMFNATRQAFHSTGESAPLQQDFQGMGVTCTMVIRDKRLRLAKEKIEQLKEQKSGGTIAEVAYSAGFNDISYFNRSFKELFDCAPTDLLKGGDC